MARPRAIYASIPAYDIGEPKWDTILGTRPVEYASPYSLWPTLDWTNNLGHNGPVEYGSEQPKYLWSDPLVQDPVNGETHVFIRQWTVVDKEGNFASQTIPADKLIVAITIAADDQYTMALVIGDVRLGSVHTPIGINHIPEISWRNIMTYLYFLDLTKTAPGTIINLMTEVTNSPQLQIGAVETNPAMFTWVMQIYNNP
jgi:hypothetical protein